MKQNSQKAGKQIDQISILALDRPEFMAHPKFHLSDGILRICALALANLQSVSPKLSAAAIMLGVLCAKLVVGE